MVLVLARADRVQVEEFYQAPLTTPRTGASYSAQRPFREPHLTTRHAIGEGGPARQPGPIVSARPYGRSMAHAVP